MVVDQWLSKSKENQFISNNNAKIMELNCNLALRVTWPSSNISKKKIYEKNKSRDLIWVEDSYIKQNFTLIDRYESHLLSTE